ncbi:phosphate ABC transporter substrate-binding protein, partial [Methylobacterium sp. WL103]
MTHICTSLRTLLAGAALLLAQAQPGLAAGFDGAIKNN